MWEKWDKKYINLLECIGAIIDANVKQVYIVIQVNVYQLHGNYKSKTYSRYTKKLERKEQRIPLKAIIKPQDIN